MSRWLGVVIKIHLPKLSCRVMSVDPARVVPRPESFCDLSRPGYGMVIAGVPARPERPSRTGWVRPHACGGPTSHSDRPPAAAVGWGPRPVRLTEGTGGRDPVPAAGVRGDVTTLRQGGDVTPPRPDSSTRGFRARADTVQPKTYERAQPSLHAEHTFTHTLSCRSAVPGPGSRPGGRLGAGYSNE